MILESPSLLRVLAALAALAAVAPARASDSIFTPAERAWIAAHPVVDYAFNPRAAPFSFEEHGEHRGLSADQMMLLSKHTGIEFRPLLGAKWPEVIEQARAGKVLLVAQLAITPQRMKFLAFTRPLLDVPYGIFTGPRGPFVESLEDLRGRRVGVPRDVTISERLRAQYPDIRQVPFDSAIDGMARLALGEYDAAITNVGAATFAANEKGVTNLRLRAVLPDTFQFAIGVSRSAPLLIDIVNKGLADIPPEEMRALRSHWLNVPGPGFTRSEMLAVAGGSAAAVFMIAAVNIALLYLRLRTRYGQLVAAESKLQELATVDELTGLGNRRAYATAIESELMRADRAPAPLAFLELDLDHFKAINDQYGHEAGDRTLTAIGRLVRAQLRHNDLAFRMGGEEFVVLLPGAGEAEARRAAERLRASVAGLRDLPAPITASIGCAVLPAGCKASGHALYSAADAALYRAKRDGRDRAHVTVCGADAHPALETPPA